MPDEEIGEFKGATKAQIETLFHRLDEMREDIRTTIRDHCDEERRTWDRFEAAQAAAKVSAETAFKEINEKIGSIQQWRAKVIGYASAVSLVVGAAVQWFFEKVGK